MPARFPRMIIFRVYDVWVEFGVQGYAILNATRDTAPPGHLWRDT